MKKTFYEAPKIECIEIEIEDAVLAGSGVGSSPDDMDILPGW